MVVFTVFQQLIFSAQNITFLSNLTKFKVVPPHVILHMFKVCLDDFSGSNIENIAMLLENCGRFLLRSDETRQPFGKMVFDFLMDVLTVAEPFGIGGAYAAQAEYAAS